MAHPEWVSCMGSAFWFKTKSGRCWVLTEGLMGFAWLTPEWVSCMGSAFWFKTKSVRCWVLTEGLMGFAWLIHERVCCMGGVSLLVKNKAWALLG